MTRTKRIVERGAARVRRLAIALAALGTGLAAAPAGAVSIWLAPAIATPLPGSPFAVELLVGGLGEGGALSLGAYDITLAFDPGAVAVTGVSFDGFLGAIPTEASADSVLGAGTLGLASFSILPSAALDALQPGSFRLATILFEATSATPSTIAISASLLGDAAGRAIPLSTPPTGTQVQPIPEPSAALVFGLCAALQARTSRGRRLAA